MIQIDVGFTVISFPIVKPLPHATCDFEITEWIPVSGLDSTAPASTPFSTMNGSLADSHQCKARCEDWCGFLAARKW
jgi:hypothetical protein